MRALSWSLFALVVLPVAACHDEVVGPRSHPDLFVASAGGELDLRLGQSARIGDDGLVVRLEQVREDSRCPTGVACVWKGNGRIVLATRGGAAPPTTVELNTTLEPGSVGVSGWRLELTELHPWPEDGVPIADDSYVARLTVSRP